MASLGKIFIGNAPYYEDEASLKQWIRKQNQYHAEETKLIASIVEQAGTGSEVEISEKAGATITKIGKTELALKVLSSAADAGLEHAVITAHYLDQDLVAHTATIADAVADMSVAVDFDTPVIDFYCWDIENYGANCFTSSLAVGAAKTLTADVGGVPYAEIAAAGTSGAALKYFGVGTVWGRSEANHNDGDGAVLTLNYTNPIGEVIEGATCTINTTDGTTEVPFMNGSYPVQDYYRTRTLTTNQIGTSNTHAFIMCDRDCANVDGSGNDIWGIIEEGYSGSVHTLYFVPLDRDAWITEICISNTVATNIVSYIKMTYTPYGETISQICKIDVPNNETSKINVMMKLAELTDLSFTFKGNLSENTFNIHIIEALKV